MAGLDPAICGRARDRRVKPGDDETRSNLIGFWFRLEQIPLELHFSVTPANAGVQGRPTERKPGFPLSRE